MERVSSRNIPKLIEKSQNFTEKKAIVAKAPKQQDIIDTVIDAVVISDKAITLKKESKASKEESYVQKAVKSLLPTTLDRKPESGDTAETETPLDKGSDISSFKDTKAGSTLEIHQLDVGQGDAALILFKKLSAETADYEIYKSMLIDGGMSFNKENIERYIKKHLGEKTLDTVILSHNEADHKGGLPTRGSTIVSNAIYESRNKVDDGESLPTIDRPILCSGTRYLSNKEGYIHFRRGGGGVKEHFSSCPVESGAGQTWYSLFGQEEPIEINHLHSISCVASCNDEKNENNNSLGFIIKHGDFKFFTAGDLESRGEEIIARKNKNISVMKIGHHGSDKSSSKKALEGFQSIAALISNGDHGGHKHPRLTVLERMKDNVSHTYITNPWSAKNEENSLKTNFILQKENKNSFTIAGDNSIALDSQSIDGKKGSKRKEVQGHIVIKTREKKLSSERGFFTINYKQKIDQENRLCRDYYHSGSLNNIRSSLYQINNENYRKISMMRSMKYLKGLSSSSSFGFREMPFNYNIFGKIANVQADEKSHISCELKKGNYSDLCIIQADIEEDFIKMSIENIDRGAIYKEYRPIRKSDHENITLFSRRIFSDKITKDEAHKEKLKKAMLKIV